MRSRLLLVSLAAASGASWAEALQAFETAASSSQKRAISISSDGTVAPLSKLSGRQETFTIVVIPDTQHYSANATLAPLFTNQTQWIADEITIHGNPRNIVFVTHAGDVVGDTVPEQMERADEAISVLAPVGGPYVAPFSMLPGNHDYDISSSKCSGSSKYVERFRPDRFANASWYGGSDATGRNSFQLFSAGGYDFLHLAIEWQPATEEFEWAAQVIETHPGLPVILTTHEYIWDGARPWWADWREPDPGNGGYSASGQQTFHMLVTKHDQIFLVLCGHFHNLDHIEPDPHEVTGEWHQVSKNDFGRDVIEVLQNYQGYPDGGSGWLRLITFDEDAGELFFETYSPALGEYQTKNVTDVGGHASQFSIPLDFASRFTF